MTDSNEDGRVVRVDVERDSDGTAKSVVYHVETPGGGQRKVHSIYPGMFYARRDDGSATRIARRHCKEIKDLQLKYQTVQAAIVRRNIAAWFGEAQRAVDADFKHLALSTALIIPDALSSIDEPNEQVGRRYCRWFNQWALSHIVDDNGNSVMPAPDCYKLRCSLVHEAQIKNRDLDVLYRFDLGEGDIARSKILDREVVSIRAGWFVKKMVDAGSAWLDQKSDDDLVTDDNFGIWHSPVA